MNEKIAYADVILPLSLPDYLTYSIPEEMKEQVEVGRRVVVPLKRHKLFSGVIYRIHNEKPAGFQVKPLFSLIDSRAVVLPRQFTFWQWMAEYYLCTLGEVMATALPSGMKMESESVVQLYPQAARSQEHVSETECLIYKMLETGKPQSIKALARAAGRKNILPVITSLYEKGLIVRKEEIKEKVKPSLVEVVTLGQAVAHSEEGLQQAFITLEKRAPRQMHLLLHLVRQLADRPDKPVLKHDLLTRSGCSQSMLNQLVKKGLAEIHRYDPWLLPVTGNQTASLPVLTIEQEQTIEKIKAAWQHRMCVLLHSHDTTAKTELTIRLIEEQVRAGRQVLYLLPEMAKATPVIHQLKKHFGAKVLVYHSRSGERERVDVWNSMLQYYYQGQQGNYQIIVGTRSALFLPFTNAGLFIIDEEHDVSYKQMDPAPRYHARDAAILLAHQLGARVLLTSATPSLESYFNILQNKYGVVSLIAKTTEQTPLPVEVADLKEATRKKRKKSVFSDLLLKAIQDTLQNQQQVILFQNRRGYSPILQCQDCYWIPTCRRCDVTLTYHKKSNNLLCHYCGYSTSAVKECLSCHSTHLKMMGYGTERIEDDLQLLFPEARIARLDLDTAGKRKSYEQIIQSFENRQIDILIGTQLITRGMNYHHVGLAGIIHVDNMLQLPDFRAAEKCFQLLMQVISALQNQNGKARMVIQTMQPNHPLINLVRNHDYEGFYNLELNERHQFGYPPYRRLIQIRLRHRNENTVEMAARLLGDALKKIMDIQILGPVIPPVGRIRNYFLRHILIKAERSILQTLIKQRIGQVLTAFLQQRDFRSVIIQPDVDPM
jgi:primosomal protein N' (replication factor Y)